MQKICNNCEYWDRKTEECRVNPPRIQDGNISGNGEWPKTRPDDWCGYWSGGQVYEFVPKNQ